MNIEIRINVDNAAFEDDLPGELARIFAHILGNVDELADDGCVRLRDSNGNTVGEANACET